MPKRVVMAIAVVVALGLPALAPAQEPEVRRPARRTDGPWLGLMPPPAPGVEPAVIVGNRMPRPVVLPAGEAASPELTGAAIRADLERIVGFSKESRATKEFGTGQLWGRVTGFASSAKTVDWAVEPVSQGGHRRRAGAADCAGSAGIVLAAVVVGGEAAR